MTLRELEGDRDTILFLVVRSAERRAAKNGTPFLRLELGDRSGTLPAKPIFDCTDEQVSDYRPGAVVKVLARRSTHPQYGPQLELARIRLADQPDDAYDPAALLDGPPLGAEQMEADLRELLATVRNDDLTALLGRIFNPDGATWTEFRDAPAAKHYHQAYRHGLLEHSLTVAQGVSAMAATFPGIDRDVAVTGALLHDIGKLEAYGGEPLAIDLTDDGRLQGEIPLGYYRVRREIDEIAGFDPALAQAVLHIVLSHHGTLEHGSPVVPATREATLVHMIDNLGGRLGSFDRIEKALPDGTAWSGYDRALGGGAWFAARAAA